MYNVYTALITPFANGKIDYKSLRNLIERQNDSDVVGVVVLGSTGECCLLDEKEKIELVKFVKKHSKKMVIAGICSPSTNQSCKIANKYQSVGVDSLLVCPPYFVSCNQSGIVKHFEKVQNATTLPIILYNVPHRTAIDVDVSCIEKISNVCNLWGVKECNDNPKKLDEYTSTNIKLFCGNDCSIDQFTQHGCTSLISVVSNLCPNVTARGCNKALFDKVAKLSAKSNPSVIKYAMYKAQMIASPQVRLPLSTPSKRTKMQVAEIVKNNKELLR